MADWNDEMMAIESMPNYAELKKVHPNIKTLPHFLADQEKAQIATKPEPEQGMFSYFNDHVHALYEAQSKLGLWAQEEREKASGDIVDHTSKFSIGEVVIDIIGNRGIVAAIPTITYLDIIYPDYDVPQSMRAAFVTKLQEAGDGQ